MGIFDPIFGIIFGLSFIFIPGFVVYGLVLAVMAFVAWRKRVRKRKMMNHRATASASGPIGYPAPSNDGPIT